MSGSSRKRFQDATVHQALQRLRDPAGSRRFLVADEVGLGKTMVARGVIDGMTQQATGRPLRVVYVCSSLSIAHQNADRLLDGLSPEERDAALIPVDRLSLVPTMGEPAQAPFHLYTITPSTSVQPTGLGRAEERALIGRALKEICNLRASPWFHEALRGNVRTGQWRNQWDQAEWPASARSYLQHFKQHLCRLLGLKTKAWASTMAAELKHRLRNESERRTTLERLRQAMTLAVLDVMSPDLVIFDEFQRFFEILMVTESDRNGDEEDDDRNEEAHHVLRTLLERGAASEEEPGPAVLLLSATPYRIFARLREGGHHHDELFKLLRFLFARAHVEHLGPLRRDFAEYREALVSDEIGSSRAIEIKRRIEERLRRVMARTERGLLAPRVREQGSMSRIAPREVESRDLIIFRHFSDCVRPRDRSAVEAYWSSIPYPIQMMGNDYKASKHAGLDKATRLARQARLPRARLGDYHYDRWAHPKLRALLDELPARLLSLPWLPPTRPWWPLQEPFAAAAGASKAIVFSRYRAVPRALATLLSYEAERQAFGEPVGDKRYSYFRARSNGQADARAAKRLRPLPAEAFSFSEQQGKNHQLLLMFLPLPALARLGDPLKIEGIAHGSLDFATAKARVRARLVDRLGEDEHRKQQRPLAWAIALEQRAPKGWNAWRAGVEQGSQRGALASQHAARAVREMFDEKQPANAPSPAELDMLAELALTAPGSVLYRVVKRVFGKSSRRKKRIAQLCHIALGPLRTYLDGAEWHRLLARSGARRSHVEAVRNAVWGGNLESVLDEYLVMLQGLGTSRPENSKEHQALEEFERALGIRAVPLQVHQLRRDRGNMSLRCHAALPFGLRASLAEEKNAVRGDRVREAFNSPFRPMALVTTSIGQEGLDFHRYCRHVVHWDLPRNPVDLEQREGRVDRYGGLAVRRALTRGRMEMPGDRSPWHRLSAQLHAQESAGGLVPWWHAAGAEIIRTAVMPRLSEQAERLAALEADLALYRYALGQPDQEKLVIALTRRLGESDEHSRAALYRWLQEAAIDLCPLPAADRESS